MIEYSLLPLEDGTMNFGILGTTKVREAAPLRSSLSPQCTIHLKRIGCKEMPCQYVHRALLLVALDGHQGLSRVGLPRHRSVYIHPAYPTRNHAGTGAP